MNSPLRIAIAAGGLALIAGSLSGKAGKRGLLKQTLCIHLQNEDVNLQTLHWATVEVNRLFRAAAIEISWQRVLGDATKIRDVDRGSTACPKINEPPYIAMRLMRQAPATVSEDALGAARPFTQTEPQISIFIDRLELLARFVTTPLYVILGHAMAHEIGHVLLYSAEHSTGGVMQTRWNAMSWHLASEGLLAFRPEEAERMNAGLAEFRNGARNAGVGITCPNAYRKTQP